MPAVANLERLTDRTPEFTPRSLLAQLVPPPQFQQASFGSYRPDPAFPLQEEAVAKLIALGMHWRTGREGGWFARTRRPRDIRPGIYLDGGFGVGKTHLMAALWHTAPFPKTYGTFIEYTAMIGAVGYATALELLRPATLVCIDEFELDDPGDTMLMTRFLGDLMSGDTRVVATSNTPPNALGEGRFAAEAFAREIHALADRFVMVRIDGHDYRRRAVTGHASVLVCDEAVRSACAAQAADDRVVTCDPFAAVVEYLSTVHPSSYADLLRGVTAMGFTGATELHDQNAALRFVAFIDRAYDAEIPIVASGIPLDAVFDADMMAGGFQKKYLRCQSRVMALTARTP